MKKIHRRPRLSDFVPAGVNKMVKKYLKNKNTTASSTKTERNPYDNEIFFEKYSKLYRSVKGLRGAGEWKTLEKMLPDFNGKRVLDLGCGFGWHCEYAIRHEAVTVVGVDISKKMLEVAHRKTSKDIRYICASLEKVKFPENSFDIIISSLAFHYLISFNRITKNVSGWLKKGGDFVFSVEHPIFTAGGTQDWHYGDNGEKLHFPVDNYFREGKRETNFLGERVIKYHTTLTTYISVLIQNGFEITGVVEPQPPKEMLRTIDGMKDELRRPMMLIISARKK